MEHTFTLNDFIRYAYNETELPDTVLIQREIDNDPDTEEMYSEVVETLKFLDRLAISPSKMCIETILNYSRKGKSLFSNI